MAVSAKVTITNTTISKAKADVKPGMKRYEIRDTKATGLVIQVQPSGLQWQYRFQKNGKSFRLILGSIDLLSIQEARELAAEAMALWKSGVGIPEEGWLRRRLVERQKIERPVVGHQDSRHAIRWTYKRSLTKYLEAIEPRLSKSTFDDYRQKLQSKDMAVLDDRPIASISRIELAQIVAGVHASGRESTAESLVRIIGPFWKWLAEDTQIQNSGVRPDVMKGLKAPGRTRKSKNRIVSDPTLEDLGRIVAIARSGALDTSVACAIELVVWSCQRRKAVAGAADQDFRPIGDGTEGLWYVYADHRKRATEEPHVIPLPPAAWACVQRAIKAKKRSNWKSSSPYLFPQFRARRDGDAVDHIHPSTITHTVSYLPGITSTPHRIRKIFGTYGEQVLGFLREETKSILDHTEGGKTTDVTGRHYALHDGSHRKWPVVRKWAAALEAEIAKATAELESVEELKAAIEEARYRTKAKKPKKIVEQLQAAE
jgi:integrase